ncbi:MAG: hypothetical protein JWM53_3677 [bacterium]|nr:hypothetical protein [bacterium]
MRRSALELAHHAAGWVALAIAVLANVHALADPVAGYDEGIILTGANLALHGAHPVRDFYTNYGPATFFVLAGIWKVVGVSLIAERLLGLLVHFAIAVLAGALGARILERRFLPLAAALTLGALTPFGTAPYAYLSALALLLGGLTLLLRAVASGRASVHLSLASGLTLGSIAAFRVDLFVYAIFFGSPLLVVLGYRMRQIDARQTMRATCAFIGGVAMAIVAAWTPILVHTSFQQVAKDFFVDQVRYVTPARHLPLPTLFSFTAAAIVVAVSAPFGALIALTQHVQRRALLALLVIWAAVLPQMLTRADLAHALYTVTPTLVLISLLAERAVKRSRFVALAYIGVLAAASIAAVSRPDFGLPRFAEARSVGRGSPLPFYNAAAKRAVVAYVSMHTAASQPIFVGCADHRRVILNDMDLYFLADRPGATRTMQFDPGLVTRADVQREMIADLDRAAPLVAVLSMDCWWPEPNRSRDLGAALLDEYLKGHYVIAAKYPPYLVLSRSH